MRPPLAPGAAASLCVGLTALLLLVGNTLLWCTALFLLALLKLLLPFARLRAPIDRALNEVATRWISGNCAWMRLTQRTAWDIAGPSALDPGRWYLVTCNHQSWVDIFVLQRVFNRRIPLLKFFLKRELFYVPVMGLAWWALDFPFMKRQSSRVQADVETSRRACERFARVPTSVMNFVEGTRVTAGKRDRQRSPYRHLLKPKTGALAASLETLGEKFDAALDVTIVYPAGAPSFRDFLCGGVPEVVVRYEEVPLPEGVTTGMVSSGDGRARLAAWLAGVWARKDAMIEDILARARTGPAHEGGPGKRGAC
jgi:1-acyl-sn-glycerol-3-phosphate acyltransferase